MTTVYKVTRQEKSKHFSIFASQYFAVEYLLGIATKPRIDGTYLLAFDTLHNAKRFVYDNVFETHFTIWCADAVVRDHVKYLHINNMFMRECTVFWQETKWMQGDHNRTHLMFDAPFGTVACSEITLIAPAQYVMEIRTPPWKDINR